MNKHDDDFYMHEVLTVARQSVEDRKAGAIAVNEARTYCWHEYNVGFEYAYIRALRQCKDPHTLYVTHEVSRRHAMTVVNAGVKRVVYHNDFDQIGTDILRSQGVIVEKWEGV